MGYELGKIEGVEYNNGQEPRLWSTELPGVVELSSTSYKLCDLVQVITILSLSFPSVKLEIVKSSNLIQLL